MTPPRFSAFLQTLCPDVERALDALLPAADESPTRLHEAVRYAIFAGGKRVRPALVVVAGERFGAPRERLLAPGAALEMIHTYSLVHDDLPALDDDDLRRGRPTVHRAFGEAMAVLVGDTLLTLGLTTLAVHPADAPAEARRRAVALVGEAVGSRGMIGGQADDLAAERSWPDDPASALESIHARKTGELLAVALRLGGLLAGAGEDDDARLLAFGHRVGLLFQIADDVLDVTGTAESLGKTAGKDAAAEKLTYTALHGVDGARALLRRTADEARSLAAELLPPQGPDRFLELVDYLVHRES